MATEHFLITCEHGGNAVPTAFAAVFDSPGGRRDLRSHRGWDPGSLDAAKQISEALGAELIASETTRLLVDLNRSLDNPTLFSKYTRSLSEERRGEILAGFYHPYREQVQAAVQQQRGNLVHLSIHTFTPRFAGLWRPIDVGLLLDPDASRERIRCERWVQALRTLDPRLRVALNQPYAGTDDGLTTALRAKWSRHQYAGIEIEINHRFFKQSIERQRRIVRLLLDSMPGV